MDNLIIIDNKNRYQISSFDELINYFFGAEYKNLSFNEKYKIRFDKAYGFTIKDNLELVDTRVGVINGDAEVISKKYDFSKAFIIDNEITFILSLCKFENILILENIDSDKKIFLIDDLIDKDTVLEENYAVINKFVDRLLLINMKRMWI